MPDVIFIFPLPAEFVASTHSQLGKNSWRSADQLRNHCALLVEDDWYIIKDRLE
jgi:hypothetical protein